MREKWASNLGFILATAGSAVGLANIIRFPYLVGENGGAAFVLIYLLALFVLGLPVFLCELAIGRQAQTSAMGVFKRQTQKGWRWGGRWILLTALIVGGYYSALAGWVFGYFIEASINTVSHLDTVSKAQTFFKELISSPIWTVGMHFLFISICCLALRSGVKKGLELSSKWLMPLLFVVLFILLGFAFWQGNIYQVLQYLFNPDWHKINTAVILLAMGQAFFTLSCGQGTLITYGSYLSKKSNLLNNSIPIVVTDTLVSLFAAVIVFSVLFANNLPAQGGLGLMFHALPVAFNGIPFGEWLAILFFMLVTLAAITSELSVLEVIIAYFCDEKGMSRQKSVFMTCCLAFVIGIPSALSFNLLASVQWKGNAIIECFDFLVTAILIPVGALASLMLVQWGWGFQKLYGAIGQKSRWLYHYLKVSVQIISPIAILLVMGSQFLLNN